MTVEDAEAPCGSDEDAGAGKEDPYQAHGQHPFGPLESRRDQIDEERGREDAEQDQDGDRQREQREEHPRRVRGRLVIAARPKRRMHRNERTRERAFAEQILKQVGDAKGGVEGIDRDAVLPEVPRDQPHAEQAREAADQDAGPDRRVRAREPARE